MKSRGRDGILIAPPHLPPPQACFALLSVLAVRSVAADDKKGQVRQRARDVRARAESGAHLSSAQRTATGTRITHHHPAPFVGRRPSLRPRSHCRRLAMRARPSTARRHAQPPKQLHLAEASVPDSLTLPALSPPADRATQVRASVPPTDQGPVRQLLPSHTGPGCAMPLSGVAAEWHVMALSDNAGFV